MAAARARDPMARIGIACCAFGNTFTLPLVFLVEVLGAAYGDRVAGYIALYLIGWSPALWTVGYMLLTGGGGGSGSGGGGGGGGRGEIGRSRAKGARDRGGESEGVNCDASCSGADGGASGAFSEGSKSIQEKLAGMRETCAVIVKETVNPPLVGIFTGVLIGVTPLRHILIGGTSTYVAASTLPPELGLVAAALKALFELAVLIGGAALPGQTLVLASSFVKFKTPAEEEAEASAALRKAEAASEWSKDANSSQFSQSVAAAGTARENWSGRNMVEGVASAGMDHIRKAMAAITSFLVLDEADARALIIASTVRFLVLPVCGIVAAVVLRAAHSPWYPADPVVALVVLTMVGGGDVACREYGER